MDKKFQKENIDHVVKKQAKLPDRIFNYIHTANCQQLIFLDWYNNISYSPNKDGSIKLLLYLFHKGSKWDPEYLNQISSIDKTIDKYKESEKE